MTEDQIRDLLREMRDEPVPAESVRRVRQAVFEGIQARSWIRVLFGRWRSAAALAGVVCIAFLIVWTRVTVPSHKPVPPVVARRQVPAPSELAPPQAGLHRTVRPAVRSRVKRAQRAESVNAPSADVLIRIETPDPDVVILLIGGG